MFQNIIHVRLRPAMLPKKPQNVLLLLNVLDLSIKFDLLQLRLYLFLLLLKILQLLVRILNLLLIGIKLFRLIEIEIAKFLLLFHEMAFVIAYCLELLVRCFPL